MKFRASSVALFVAVAAVIVFPFTDSAFYTELLAKAMILAIFALSLDLLVGYTGLVSFGHAAYFGIGAYATVLLAPKYDPASLWVVLPGAVVAAGLAALIIGLFVLRTRGIYFIMVTLAFAQMVYYVFHDTAIGGGSDGIYLNFKPSAALGAFRPFDLEQARQQCWFVTAALLITWWFLARLLRSPFGRAIVGIRSNEQRMRALGFATVRYKLAAFTIAGAIAGLAGSLYAILFGFVTPELLSWHQSGNVLLMVILGGIGSFAGSVGGAFAFVAMQEVFSGWTRHWQLLMGGVIVAAVLFLPGGLAALPGRLKRAFGADRG
ncbi:MAG: branched-chain amino acid ABC transporter permease [Burkholderiales bacterium]|nr:branched-chain amino acid ABC transporter permease [Burkholderiales bacterium]